MGLDVGELRKLVTPRTRLVAFTACSNVLGGFVDIRSAASVARAQSGGRALVAVDCVAFAPHRPLRPASDEWGLGQVDLALFSMYKVYGPHVGVAYISPRLREHMGKLNHFFLPPTPGAGTYPLQPSSVQYELNYAVSAVADYLVNQHAVDWAAVMHASPNHSAYATPSPAATPARSDTLTTMSRSDAESRLQATFAAWAAHEETLSSTLLGWLTDPAQRARGVRVVGPESPAAAVRAPTIAFVVQGRPSADVHAALVSNGKVSPQHTYTRTGTGTDGVHDTSR